MNTILAQAQTLNATAKAQTLSGLWDKVECAPERQYLNLSNSKDGTDITVCIRACGNKASVYRLPKSKQNTIVVNNTEEELDAGIAKMVRRIKSGLRLLD